MRDAKTKVFGRFQSVLFIAFMIVGTTAKAEDFLVKATLIEDKKAVFATVESSDSVAARVRITGTVADLSVTEGDLITAGDVIARVKDPKLDLRIDAIEAQIRAAQREIVNLKSDLERASSLFQRGSTTKARLDQIKTRYDVALNRLEASEAQKAVLERQLEEGAVLAPQSGRVLNVPITIGSVVLPGEAVATIAKDNYILRLSLPERHARFLQKGDKVELASRGLACKADCDHQGTIEKVYPQITNGRVLADALVQNLGDYFVGERIQVRVGVGERLAFLVPETLVKRQFGMDFVRLKINEDDYSDIAVQVGQSHPMNGRRMVEILAGLQPGDRLIKH